MIHPLYAHEDEHEFEEEEEDEYETNIDMAHGALSPDNKLISFGEQGSDHRVGGNNGVFSIKPASEYPHFTLFSKDGAQVLLNSCHMYIWGNASGYIKAYDYKGKYLWQYYIGGTISGMAVSEDESTLYVGSYAGGLHQLKLNAGQRDNHTIGTGKHYEECRWLFWRNEAGPLKW